LQDQQLQGLHVRREAQLGQQLRRQGTLLQTLRLAMLPGIEQALAPLS
jgi:hypothetical protein